MKNTRYHNIIGNRHYHLADEKMINLDVRKIQIECLQGVVWVTWPDGNERVLKNGQAMTVVSKGLICVQAFAASTIVLRKTEKEVPQLCLPYRPTEVPAG